jgi:hypothetical protein
MTESIFDPTGPETEHSGTRYMGPKADNDSHMPPDVTDGKVDEEDLEAAPDEDPQTEQIADAEATRDSEESQSEL